MEMENTKFKAKTLKLWFEQKILKAFWDRKLTTGYFFPPQKQKKGKNFRFVQKQVFSQIKVPI